MITEEGALSPIAARRVAGHAHLIGIAGSGMRALAEVLLGRGWTLSGSDPTIDAVRYLAARRVRLYDHHAAENLPADCAIVIHSDAIGADNPELVRAAERGIPRSTYFEVLGQWMSAGTGLAVAGTHGKSTTTAMAAHILVQAGFDPTVVCGATPLARPPLGQSPLDQTSLGQSSLDQTSLEHPCDTQPSGGRAGRSDLILVEACEYRRNFLNLRPHHAVILGIEPDHFDCYDGLSDLEDAFARFAGRVPPDGRILAAYGCPATRRVVANAPARVETFGLNRRADWSARSLSSRRGKYRFEICHHGRPICDVSLPVPGRHNVLNALAAGALAWHRGVAGQQIGRSLAGFPGLSRRFETLVGRSPVGIGPTAGVGRGMLMIDDYAHHPTEVAATLRTVRQVAPHRRVWCLFQPHQASRTERLLDELAVALHNADKVLVAEIFRAREGPLRSGGITAADLARRIRLGGTEVADLHGDDEIVGHLQTHLEPGDVLITMGAGDIRKIAERLRGHSPESRAEKYAEEEYRAA